MDDPLSQSDSLRKMAAGAVTFVVVCVVAVIGYLAAGWTVDDAIYMVVITIFGVGYGEVRPVETAPIRALTIMVIVLGYGAVIYTVGGFIQLVVDGELNRALGARRMTREIEQLRGHTIVCGFGRMGRQLCQELEDADRPFVVVDADHDVVEQCDARGYLVLAGDATDEEVLARAGIERAGALATVLPDDATNVFVTLTARAVAPELQIVARAEHPRTEAKLQACGADRVVMPTTIGASKMSQIILKPTASELLDRLRDGVAPGIDVTSFGLEFDQVVVDEDSAFAGKTLGEVEVKGAHGYVVIGIRRHEGETILHPPVDTLLQAGDSVVFLGYEDDLLEVEPRLGHTVPSISYRGANG